MLIRISCGIPVFHPYKMPAVLCTGFYHASHLHERLPVFIILSRQVMRINIRGLPLSKPVYRTANARRPTVENMGVDHGRLHIAVAQEFLHCSDVIATLEQVSGKGMQPLPTEAR